MNAKSAKIYAHGRLVSACASARDARRVRTDFELKTRAGGVLRVQKCACYTTRTSPETLDRARQGDASKPRRGDEAYLTCFATPDGV